MSAGDDRDEARHRAGSRRRPPATLADDRVLDVASAPTGTPSSVSCVAGSSANLTPVSRASAMIDSSMVTAMTPMQQQRGRGVLALRLLERGHAVADRLDTGERRTAGGERAQQQEDHREPGEASRSRCSGSSVELRRSRPAAGRRRPPDEADDAIPMTPSMNAYVGHRERRAGLAHAAQVHRGQQRRRADRDDRLVPAQGRSADAGVLHARGDRHRDGQHVVDQQRAGHGQPGPRAEVDGRDLVVAAARG